MLHCMNLFKGLCCAPPHEQVDLSFAFPIMHIAHACPTCVPSGFHTMCATSALSTPYHQQNWRLLVIMS